MPSNIPSPSSVEAPHPPAQLRGNIELKARLHDIAVARERARTIATATEPPQHQVDTYFRAAEGRLKLREINGTSAQLVWYRRSNDANSRASDYLLVPVTEPALLKQSLAGAMGIVGVVEKHREIFFYENVRIHLDQVVGRGSFLEFEAVLDATQTDPAGHEQLALLRRHFVVADADLMSGSYGDA